MSLPERDKLSYSKQWCQARIAMSFGGRVAEQLIYGMDHLNTGAASDIMQATDLARRMVTEWGMSGKLGPLRYNENQQEVFLGHAITQRQNMSEDTAKLIDEEIRRIVTEGETTAREVVSSHRRELEAITQALMEYETISGQEVNTLIRGEKIVRRPDDEGPKDQAGSSSTVPTTGGRLRPRGEPGPGSMEPQPQG
jgi:cell division protease FtsH